LVCGTNGEALESGERLAGNDAAANRAVPALFFVGMDWRIEMQMDREVGVVELRIDVVKKLRAGIGAIEARLVQAQQFEFARASRGRGGAAFESDRLDFMHETREAARDAIGIGVFVKRQASAEILGLANVENPIGIAAHDINAGFTGRGFEEIVAETLDQGLGHGK
jgi:hypothetical protein